MFKLIARVIVALGATAAATSASAQACGDRETLVAQPGADYEEHPVAAGLHDPEHLVELWTSKDGATWTLLLSRADGYSCTMGSGSAWSPHAHTDLAGVEG